MKKVERYKRVEMVRNGMERESPFELFLPTYKLKMFDKLKIWLRGDSNWKAEQELDGLGKNDAFLADAMEGYRSLPEADHSKAVNDLKAKLNSKYSKKKRGIVWWNYAAAAAVIGVIGLFFWIQRSPVESGVIAEVATPVEESTPARPEEKSLDTRAFKNETIASPIDDSKDKETANAEKFSPPIASNESVRKQADLKLDPSNIEAGIIEEQDLAEADEEEAKLVIVEPEPTIIESEDMAIELADAPIQVAERDKDEVYKNEEYLPAAPLAKAATKEMAGADIAVESRQEEAYDEISNKKANTAQDNVSQSQQVINGIVMDLSTGEFLIGANVLIKDSGEGTTTDFDGKFTLKSNQTLPWTLVVSNIGYTDEEIEIKDFNDPLLVRLSEGALLEEVVITSASRSRSKAKRSMDSMSSGPQPQSSFKKLERYIRKKMNYPDDASRRGVEGGVIVRFYINADGKPEQLSTLNSIGHGCDEEAMRLIKEGPKWKPANRWATYTVKFKL